MPNMSNEDASLGWCFAALLFCILWGFGFGVPEWGVVVGIIAAAIIYGNAQKRDQDDGG